MRYNFDFEIWVGGGGIFVFEKSVFNAFLLLNILPQNAYFVRIAYLSGHTDTNKTVGKYQI